MNDAPDPLHADTQAEAVIDLKTLAPIGSPPEVAPSAGPAAIVEPSAEAVAAILDLHSRGFTLRAYRAAEQVGPLPQWRGRGRVCAGRLAGNLGTPRLGYWHHTRAWREQPDDPESCYYYAHAVLDRRGLLAAWRFTRKIGELSGAPPEVRADWLAFRAKLAAKFRDFDRAEALLARAEQLAPGRPWIGVERGSVLEAEDRLPEALEAVRGALELQPWYRPAVMFVAYLLQMLDRDAEALHLLRDACERIENGLVAAQLSLLELEMGHHADAQRSLDRVEELWPLMEKDARAWLYARRCDLACERGDTLRAAELARSAGGPFYLKVAEHLQAKPDGRRKLLPVGFVRQHYMTCAPATLSAISQFWNMPADHLEIAEAICYDGTPDHSERHWAETHGYLAREFTVTWDSAVALIDRGVPFTLTTSDAANAHLQAVVGYDERRGTLLLRDSNLRNVHEALAEGMLEVQRATGPRGMALVPKGRTELLDGLALPDAELYDGFHRLQRALQLHDRKAAQREYEAIRSAAPGHRLTLHARRTLAGYDCNSAEALAAIEEQLALFTDDDRLLLSKLSLLREIGQRDDRLALLEKACQKHPCDPLFWQNYAQELMPDARQHPTASRLLHRVIRGRPDNPFGYLLLANLLWDQRQFAEATRLYRLAACLNDKDERLAQSYFTAARHRKQTGQAIRLLRNRFQRFGKQSSQPARTLYSAYSQLERMRSAFRVLREARQLRPDDGELILFAAEEYARSGRPRRARKLLESAAGKAPPQAAARAAANVAAMLGDLSAGLTHWRAVLAVEPLALDAHRALARLLAETESPRAALDYLQQTCARFPHHYELHRLWIEFLRNEGPAAVEPAVREMLASHPNDAWAHRELALACAEQGRLDEAFREAELAGRLEPHSPNHWGVVAHLHFLSGQVEPQKQALRQVITLCADSDQAIVDLIAACDTRAERREALAFVEREVVRQTVFGDGLLAFREQARHTLEPDELLAILQEALANRPDLWHAWLAVIRQLTYMNRLDEARKLARRAIRRFPLLLRLWYEFALVEKARGNRRWQRLALRQALRINPAAGIPARELASIYEARGDWARVRSLMERAVARAPLDALNHGVLADALWHLGERELALSRVEQALRLDPSYDWAWNALSDWSVRMGRPQLAGDFARDLTGRRGGEARSWIRLARVLSGPEALDERLSALDRAIALQPRNLEAHDCKAELLAQAGRFDEARRACQPECLAGPPPLTLRARAAWIQAERGDLLQAAQEMEAVLAEDPSYYWALEQLANWYNRMGRYPDYLRISESLVRLAPDHPVSFGYRGEARLRVGDRAGAKADFERAIYLDAGYLFAGMTLFDQQLEDQEFDAAEATLMRMRSHASTEHLLAREVVLAARRNDPARADNPLRQLATFHTEEENPLRLAIHACRQAGWHEELRELVKSVLADPEINPLFLRIYVETWAELQSWQPTFVGDDAQYEFCLAVLDRAIERTPADTDPYDLKADLLARRRRFDEAVAALRLDRFEGPIPVFLRGRAAWIENERGRRKEAIQRMNQVLEQDPDYYWGWQRLAEWYDAEKSHDAYRNAAEQLVRLAPQHPVSHGYLGEARLRCGVRSGAKQAFRQAFTLSPDYAFAGHSLFDVQVEEEDYVEAEATLRTLLEHSPQDVYTRWRAVLLPTRRNQRQAALDALQEFCLLPAADETMIQQLIELLDEAGWRRDADRALREVLHDPQVNPAAGAAWVQRCMNDGKRGFVDELLRLIERGPVGLEAAAAYAWRLGEMKKAGRLSRFVNQNRTLLRSDTGIWGRIGAALAKAGDYARAVAWCQDYQSRDGVTPALLIDHALHLRTLHRVAEANAVSADALQLPEADFTTPFHHLWLVIDEAIDGDAAQAWNALQAVEEHALDDYHQYLKLLAEAVLQVHRAGPANRTRAAAAARRQSAEAARKFPVLTQTDGLLATYRRCLRSIANASGSFGVRLWAWWRRRFPIVPAAKAATE